MNPLLNRYAKRILYRLFEKRPHLLDELLQQNPAFVEQWLQMQICQRYQLPIPLDHYYSPLPNLPALKQNPLRWYKKGFFEPAQWSLERQISLCEKLYAYQEESRVLPTCAELTEEGYGLGYGEVEARLLYLMLRHFRPRRVIEVGSGVSTIYTLSALDANARDTHSAQVLCIEPYPSEKIRELALQGRVELRAQPVQDIAVAEFQILQQNDVLFIDSTHVVKIDSDVNWLYLTVLPQLHKGVVIQIHDIHFPYLVVSPEHPLFDLTMLWNEGALVQAFLAFNSAFQVLLCSSQILDERSAILHDLIGLAPEAMQHASSLWLQKIS